MREAQCMSDLRRNLMQMSRVRAQCKSLTHNRRHQKEL